MSEWSLATILASLHEDIESRLAIARRSFAHPGTKGDASEGIWIELLEQYLPKRYQVAKAHVVDSQSAFSEQIDVLVFDRQYSPFIFTFKEQTIVPAESVYAVFEAKQSINASHVEYAQKKVASVRKLHRTSLPIPHAGGTYPAKPLIPILGGILSLESDWSPAMGEPLERALAADRDLGKLDLGCIGSHGHFVVRPDGTYDLDPERKPATAFLLKLISMLQFSGTVPMIDVDAYAEWLAK